MERDAHIRLADPWTPGAERNRVLRSNHSCSCGLDTALRLDQDLLFVCFQRDLAAGFSTIQARLTGEPREAYIRPIGGGSFFMFPGIQEPGAWLGRSLSDADLPQVAGPPAGPRGRARTSRERVCAGAYTPWAAAQPVHP